LPDGNASVFSPERRDSPTHLADSTTGHGFTPSALT